MEEKARESTKIKAIMPKSPVFWNFPAKTA